VTGSRNIYNRIITYCNVRRVKAAVLLFTVDWCHVWLVSCWRYGWWTFWLTL